MGDDEHEPHSVSFSVKVETPLDLPPSPPPLPLVHESLVEAEAEQLQAHDALLIATAPPENQIGNDCDGEGRMKAQRIHLNCSEDHEASLGGTGNVLAASVQEKLHYVESNKIATQKPGNDGDCYRKGTELVDRADSEEPRADGQQHFTPLLWMAPSQHRTSRISNQPSEIINVRLQRPAIPYHPLCEPALKKLGLYQISQMRHVIVDKLLIAALVERWRPETHTFHMPVGEMTVTLQDVSCLWGLPIQGDPITGESDAMWGQTIEEYLGIPISEQRMKQKKRKKKGTNDVVFTSSEYAIRLQMLRERFHAMPVKPTKAQIDQYTRAFVLDLLGSVIFEDGSGSSVPAMYLQFLKNLEEPRQYNWGAAALAVLYRGLCMGAESGTKQIGGPVSLLQLWSWTRLTVGRPIDRENNPPKWGSPDLESCPAYGAKWCTRHLFPNLPRNPGIEYYRKQLDLVCEDWVTWHPYDEVLHLMPKRVQEDRPFWLARIPLIFFWLIEYHYPDRVMRQFGLLQTVPPPLPHKESEVRRLHKIKHTSSWAGDWSAIHRNYVDEYFKEYSKCTKRMIVDEQQDEPSNLPAYHRWFLREGMYTIFSEGHNEVELDGTTPTFSDTTEVTGYVPSGSALARVALRSVKQAAWAIKLQLTAGWKDVGKVLLRTCHGNLKDTNMECRLQEMLKEAQLPLEIDELPSDDESPPAYSVPMPQPPSDTNVDAMDDDWLYSGRGFTRYLKAGLIGEGNQENGSQEDLRPLTQFLVSTDESHQP